MNVYVNKGINPDNPKANIIHEYNKQGVLLAIYDGYFDYRTDTFAMYIRKVIVPRSDIQGKFKLSVTALTREKK